MKKDILDGLVVLAAFVSMVAFIYAIGAVI